MMRLFLCLFCLNAACADVHSSGPASDFIVGGQGSSSVSLDGGSERMPDGLKPSNAGNALSPMPRTPDGMNSANADAALAVIEVDAAAVGIAPNRSPTIEAQTFHDISGRFVGNASKRRYGMAVTDFDDDGDFEVVVTGYGQSNEVWDHQGGRLVDVAPPTLHDADRRAIGVAACDLDGDGLEEIYFLNAEAFEIILACQINDVNQ